MHEFCAKTEHISIHALLAESDVVKKAITFYPPIFLSTLSLRRATRNIANGERQKDISIHALLAESDPASHLSMCNTPLFLSTLSLRRATTGGQSCNSTFVHFYPRSPCGERLDGFEGRQQLIGNISIHALLAESDTTTPHQS